MFLRSSNSSSELLRSSSTSHFLIFFDGNNISRSWHAFCESNGHNAEGNHLLPRYHLWRISLCVYPFLFLVWHKATVTGNRFLKLLVISNSFKPNSLLWPANKTDCWGSSQGPLVFRTYYFLGAYEESIELPGCSEEEREQGNRSNTN